MMYFDEIAEILTSYEVMQGLPAGLIRLYVLLVLVRGEDVTLADVHDAWCAYYTDRTPAHPCLVPFDQLSPLMQEREQPYADAIAQAARRVIRRAR